MAQIWLTYSEFGDFVGCDEASARGHAVRHGLDRRQSRDGMTRVKLSSDLATAFMMAFAAERLGAAAASQTGRQSAFATRLNG